MEKYAKEMIEKGFPKELVESGVEFVKSGLKDSCICGSDTEAFDLLQSFSLACYMAGARKVVDIAEANNGKR